MTTMNQLSKDNYLRRYVAAEEMDTNEAFAAGVLSVFQALGHLHYPNRDDIKTDLLDDLEIGPAFHQYVNEVMQPQSDAVEYNGN